jgi:hypothetical protein
MELFRVRELVPSVSGCGRQRSPEGLPAGTAVKPIQLQDSAAGILQPIGNFSCLKRLVSGAEVPIHQLGYLLSGARPFDLVQRSPNVFVETKIRI